ncbi:hypothetical protein SERLA73DRAFT_79841 [Serpula lacrymans var. lacrymans S7.3]|uniref:Uncharacterized protein n=1 Tax=Serpula lacrymans var. lacrymans (strain S7.3) TaxID=936435 RepID=F8QHS9_SERL3|nr:hypothetical protein SERLA73DRAFT_79841 [Serpula lacrymans var. lacrymans S7.3]
MSAHIPQSLPSFAQAFSNSNLSSFSSTSNALPPIHPRNTHSPSDPIASRQPSVENPSRTRKRSREDGDPDRQSPRVVRIKQEDDHEPSPPPPQHTTPPPPSNPLSKRRRVTVSGPPHPLNTNVRSPSSEHTSSTPISPVVMGFTIGDDPAAIEQVRNMLSVKQKQKALIEQRRGSTAGIVSVGPGAGYGATPVVPSATAAPHVLTPVPRMGRRSPNTAGHLARRATVSNNARPPSPSPIIVPSQQPISTTTTLPVVPSQQPISTATTSTSTASAPNSLPPPPISFARRRASQLGGPKKKPADILISPRAHHPSSSSDSLAPVIQSAPPVASSNHGHALGHGEAGGKMMFQMAIPRLPVAMGGQGNVRRVVGKVPPTPTRMGMQRSGATTAGAGNATTGAGGPSVRSPPAASIPISSALVPPTPSSLHHPGYTGDKSAFLAPFEVFYDALNDSKQLKNWLSEQLQKSALLAQSLKAQQERMEEVVQGLVEGRVRGVREEVERLGRRVEVLEEALRRERGEGNGQTATTAQVGKHAQNGVPPTPEPSTSYTFPSVESLRRPDFVRRVSSPGWGAGERERERERDYSQQQQSEGGGGSNGSPPVHFDTSRRLSVSAARLDPPAHSSSSASSRSHPLQQHHQPLSQQGQQQLQPQQNVETGRPSVSPRMAAHSHTHTHTHAHSHGKAGGSGKGQEHRSVQRVFYPASSVDTSASASTGGGGGGAEGGQKKGAGVVAASNSSSSMNVHEDRPRRSPADG